MTEYHGKTLDSWRQNAKEDYIKTPINVLKYITCLEECIQQVKAADSVGVLTNQKLIEMAKMITSRQKRAKEYPTDKVDWNVLEELWFDWLREELGLD